jgi:hypothetical protein
MRVCAHWRLRLTSIRYRWEGEGGTGLGHPVLHLITRDLTQKNLSARQESVELVVPESR